jgi:hypothetical protein
MLLPCTSVYRVIKTGVYVVQPYTEGPVASTAFGEPTTVAPEDFRSKIADVVLANLDKFGNEKYDRSRAIRLSPSEQRQFLKQHLGVSVQKLESGSLAIYALHREGGGMVGSDEDTIELPAGASPQALADAIAEAFKRAT